MTYDQIQATGLYIIIPICITIVVTNWIAYMFIREKANAFNRSPTKTAVSAD